MSFMFKAPDIKVVTFTTPVTTWNDSMKCQREKNFSCCSYLLALLAWMYVFD